MTPEEARLERVAKALYIASGGDESVFPWPCRGADRYRQLARAAADAYVTPDYPGLSAGWVSENAAKPLTILNPVARR